MNKIAPGGVVGILGGGQLGRMLSMAAARMGLDVIIFAPESDSCASRVSADVIVAEYDDEASLVQFAKRCDVITFEFENIPASTLDIIEKAGTQVFPKSNALGCSQDRLKEKEFLTSIGIPPAPFSRVEGPEDILPALKKLGGKGVLKGRSEGYDGKGQARVDESSDPEAAWDKIGKVPAVLEAFIAFEREISVLVARGQDGQIAIFDTPENDHAGGILKSSTLPANISDATRKAAKELGQKLAEQLEYVGIIALELFVMPDGSLLANEFAPRVHNTGHWTEEACLIGQFEQHMRAVCGWPLASPERFVDIRMDNLLGDRDIASWETLAQNGSAPRIYAKRGGGEGRKLGHSNKILS
ncbi:5-(carboxyamino)imidazole ribonucleotide synthase [Hirschia baltica]|uniref:N5-carboxyaminoimidazole ribonucleotide synthase n=1 Tax=Hirschia baltica (strain ATCC 49814 / DSM 5838 / IFAM 1418) TaxID=582402 RepID=C6XRL7_HIRBI|nr:5-(carboxyamino)imidazole ribonucleotide synthase [Hirschia baltica]ACT60627.1 phosphoribosylaminoimidazole carboxylase, ATPase subunit [Hirschia baltica ATCC 49814]